MSVYLLLSIVAAVLLISASTPTFRRVWLFHLSVLKYLTLAAGDLLRLRPLWHRVTGRSDYRRLTLPMAARLVCEDMGVTFVKFGQIVASSAGVFPERYVTEFQRVLDQVRPFGFDEVQQILSEDLGAEDCQRLLTISQAPLASASVAQVHSAELHDGTKVVIKVQRPNIKKIIVSDVKILRFLAAIVEKLSKNARVVNLSGIIADLETTLGEETDFRLEADNLERFNEIMREHDHQRVHAPVPHREFVTERVLVMERFFGTRVDDVEGIAARGVNAEDALIEGMHAWFQCVVFHGFFHGDVHAGNLMLLDNEDLGFLDFGIVGRFDDDQRYMVTDYMIAFATSNFKAVANTVVKMGGTSGSVDLDAFAEDLETVCRPLLGLSFVNINSSDLLPKVTEVARKYDLTMPREFVLITKQLLYFDRYAKLLAPELNVFKDPRLLKSLMIDIIEVRKGRG